MFETSSSSISGSGIGVSRMNSMGVNNDMSDKLE